MDNFAIHKKFDKEQKKNIENEEYGLLSMKRRSKR